MIVRCLTPRACFRALTRCHGRTFGTWRSGIQGYQKRFAQHASHQASRRIQSHQHDVFKRLRYPDKEEFWDPSVWLRLLEAGLPPHLHSDGAAYDNLSIDVNGVAGVLLAADRVSQETGFDGEGVDLLFHLGVTQGRWSAVVWIVKRLVEAFGGKDLHQEPEPQGVFSWRSDQSLKTLTENEFGFDLGQDVDLIEPSGSSSVTSALNQITNNTAKESEQHEILRRDCLGLIWRSLGHMTMACVDDEMKPEVLEIIAYLHHNEVMPMSIYNQRPSPDSTAIQQPPTLRLFSSRILTSLSDAAWRAHEKAIVEEAKAKGGEYASLRPEIPGMAYRVRVAGLRPEVWMELILWSCLHGGWIADGAAILRKMYVEPPQREWRSLSWRSMASSLGVEGEDWDKLDFAYNTQTTQSSEKSDVQIHRTISSEIVNAYIDAILSIMRLGFDFAGLAPGNVLRQLRRMKKLLDRSGLSLSTGTWDAVLLRYFELDPSVVDRRNAFQQLMELSPVMGEELHSDDVSNVPEYVMDGSAAVLGLFHRALLSAIKAGDVNGAFRLFQALQDRADANKHRSIVDFMRKQQLSQDQGQQVLGKPFTSYFSGIDYPAFDLQIPPTTLGPFLDLVADAKAYDFGSWLLHSHDLDGPVIPTRIYSDPALTPVLIRFAAETGDGKLLDELIKTQSRSAKPGQPKLPSNILQSFFNSQVNLKRWDAAERILQRIDQEAVSWNPVNLGHVTRAMLTEFRNPNSDDTHSDFTRAKNLFVEMINGDYARKRTRFGGQISTILTILGSLDSHWANFCLDFDYLGRFHYCNLPTKALNLVLEGVVDAYGSVAGRRSLEILWSHDSGHPQRVDGDKEANFTPLSSAQESHRRPKRRLVRISGDRDQDVAIYGRLQPDLMSIRIIFRKALEELGEGNSEAGFASSLADLAHESADAEDADVSRLDMIVWAIKSCRALRMSDEDILAELQGSLDENEMRKISAKVPRLFGQSDEKEEVRKKWGHSS